jgi:hypothetical protein
MAIAIFAANGLGDATMVITGRIWEGFIGVTVAVATVFWLDASPGEGCLPITWT